MSAGQTSQWKWALKLTNKCVHDFPALNTRVQLRELSACGSAKKFVIGCTRSDVSDSQQVTQKAGTSCSHEQHSQKVCLTEDNNFIMNFLPRLPLSFKLMHHAVKTGRK